MRAWQGAFQLMKEVARHVLRRPVVGIVAIARVPDGRYLLVRRTDVGLWATPGGTLEWGETLRSCIERELAEEAGADLVELGDLVGVYSAPHRDARFHAVTVVVHARVREPSRPPSNPLEISEVGLFAEGDLPDRLAHGMDEMLAAARSGRVVWE